MFFSTICRNLRKNICYNETLIRKFPFHLRKIKFPEYHIKNVDIFQVNTAELYKFPSMFFGFFKNSDLKKILTELHNKIINSNKPDRNDSYTHLLQIFTNYRIYFDPNAIIQDILNKNIPLNEKSVVLLFRQMNIMGDLKGAKQLLDIVKEKSLNVNSLVYVYYYGLYLQKGYTRDAAKVVKNYNLDTNAPKMLVELAVASMVLNHSKRFKEIMTHIKTYCDDVYVLHIFEEAVEIGQPESRLNKILNYSRNPISQDVLHKIMDLNRNDYFKQSFLLVNKFEHILLDSTRRMAILAFNDANCPIDIYKAVILLLGCNQECMKNIKLFSSISIDDSFNLFEQLIENNDVKKEFIFNKLLLRVIQEDTVQLLDKCIDYGLKYLDSMNLNSILLNNISEIAESYGSYDRLLASLVTHKDLFLSICLMDLLIGKEFDRFKELKNKYVVDKIMFIIDVFMVRNMYQSCNTVYDINEFEKHCKQVFYKGYVQSIVRAILESVMHKYNDGDEEFKYAKEFAESIFMDFNRKEYQMLIAKHPECKSIYGDRWDKSIREEDYAIK